MRLLLDLGLQENDFVPGVRVEDQVVAAACPHKQLQRAMRPPHRISSRVLFLCIFGNSSHNVSGCLSGELTFGEKLPLLGRGGYSDEKHLSEGLGLGSSPSTSTSAHQQAYSNANPERKPNHNHKPYPKLNLVLRVPVTLTLGATLNANTLTFTLTFLRLSPHRLL